MLLSSSLTSSLQLLATLHVVSAVTLPSLTSKTTTTAAAITPVLDPPHNAYNTCVAYYQTPNIRYPPSPLVNRTTNTTISQSTPWLSPPQSHLWSPYAITHSTRQYYQTLLNMQATHYPYFPQSAKWPPGSQVDIISWSRHDSSLETVFGYFAPVSGSAAAWRYSSTGPLVNVTNLWAVIGWGVDDEGIDYRVDYETGYQVAGGLASDSIPCVNVASRRVGGPSNTTYGQIVEGLVRVGTMAGDQGFVKLVGGLKRLRSDGSRDNLREVECDEACTMNRDLVPGK